MFVIPLQSFEKVFLPSSRNSFSRNFFSAYSSPNKVFVARLLADVFEFDVRAFREAAKPSANLI